MSENVRVSVVLPVYNGMDFLDAAIDSILKQSLSDFEFIIVNDGSSDGSLDIIKKWSSADKRIKVISRKNKGLIYSLDEALALSKGKYIARMDADDISLPNRLLEQYNFLENTGKDICGCHYEKFNKGMHSIEYVPVTEDMIKLSLVSQVPFAHPSVMIRKNFLVKHALRYGNTGYANAEDLALWMSMYKAGAKFGNVDKILFKYRVLDGSLSKKNRAGLILDTRKMTREYYLSNKVGLDFLFSVHLDDFSENSSKIMSNYMAKSIFMGADYKNALHFSKVPLTCLLKSVGREIKIKLGL